MEKLTEIRGRVVDCSTYKFGLFNADKLAHEDAPWMLGRLEHLTMLHYPKKLWESDREYTLICSECSKTFPCGTVMSITSV